MIRKLWHYIEYKIRVEEKPGSKGFIGILYLLFMVIGLSFTLNIFFVLKDIISLNALSMFLLILSIIVLTEILFWFFPYKNRKVEDWFKETIKEKLSNLISSIFIIFLILWLNHKIRIIGCIKIISSLDDCIMYVALIVCIYYIVKWCLWLNGAKYRK